MSDPTDPIAIAERAISKMRSAGNESEYNIARAVIAALEKAGWRIFRGSSNNNHIAADEVYDCAPTFTPPAEERK